MYVFGYYYLLFYILKHVVHMYVTALQAQTPEKRQSGGWPLMSSAFTVCKSPQSSKETSRDSNYAYPLIYTL